MVLVVLEGVGGVGKTTLARALSRAYGLRYVAVEAVECWPLPAGAERQRCFLAVFDRAIRRAYAECMGETCVLDNGYLTVAAYSLAVLKLGSMDGGLSPYEIGLLTDTAMLALHYAYMLYGEIITVFLVDAPDAEIRARILRRLPQRSSNRVEAEIELHLQAQAELRAIARRKAIPVVENTGSPEGVAKKLYERHKQAFREATRE